MNDVMIAGVISGTISTLVGFPFDTIKGWKQSNYLSGGNIRSYFRGISYPLVNNALSNSLLFYQYESIKKKFKNQPFILYSSLSIFNTIITCPIDKFKIMNQQKKYYPFTPKNFLLSFKDIGIVGMRKIPGTILYFSIYETMRKYNQPIFLAGGFAGIFSWFFTFPIDTIKTRIQNGSSKTIKDAYKKGNLWSGLSFCISRAFFVNGIHFYIYESSLKNYRNWFKE